MADLSATQQATIQMVFAQCRDAVRQRQLAAEIPKGYVNFDLALGVLNGALEALNSQEWDSQAAARNIRVACAALQLFNAGPAAPAVTVAVRELGTLGESYPLEKS